MIESEKITTSFHTNFSSYSNKHTTEERFMLKLTHPPQINTKMKTEDDEIGIFGAEKYFKGDIDEQLLRTPSKKAATRYHPDNPQEHKEQCPEPEPKPEPKPKTPSVRSESSWNSQRGLLVSNRPNNNDHRRRRNVKRLLTSLGCNCNDKASVKITDNRVHVKEVAKNPVKMTDSGQKTKSLSTRWADEDLKETKMKREDCFSFPVLHQKLPEPDSSEPFGSPVLEKGKKSFSLERKLTMLNWDGVTPRSETIDITRNGNNETGSDASSDLFELESFSTNENNSFLARQVMEKSDGSLVNMNGYAYAPSEVSVDWSVVTVEDTSAPKPCKSVGILSGCKSVKSVRVSGETREWCRRLDSATPMAKIQADTKLLGQRASHHLYIQQ